MKDQDNTDGQELESKVERIITITLTPRGDLLCRAEELLKKAKDSMKRDKDSRYYVNEEELPSLISSGAQIVSLNNEQSNYAYIHLVKYKECMFISSSKYMLTIKI